MGFRHAGVLAAVSFFLGVLFIAFNVDRRILYSGSVPTEEDYVDAFKFYTTFLRSALGYQGFNTCCDGTWGHFDRWQVT